MEQNTEIEHMLENCESGGNFQSPYSGELSKQFMDAVGLPLQPSLHFQPSSLQRIADSVRNIVLDWALQLEEDGVLGEGISFSRSEIEMAKGFRDVLVSQAKFPQMHRDPSLLKKTWVKLSKLNTAISLSKSGLAAYQAAEQLMKSYFDF